MGLFPVLRDADELGLVSQCLHHFRASDMRLETVDGQAATFSRADGTTRDAFNGGSFSVGNHIPAWEGRTMNVDGVATDAMCLRLGSLDRLRFPVGWLTQSFGFFFEFVHGTPSSSQVLVSISNNAATGARWWISWDGTRWSTSYYNGTTGTGATLATAPTVGQTVRLWGYFTDNGSTVSVQLFQSINSGAVTSTSASTPITRFFGWGSGYDSDINVRYSHIGNTAGALAWHRVGKIIPVAPTYAQLVRTL